MNDMLKFFGNSYMTSGVSEFAESKECVWLVTDIIAYAMGINEWFQVWDFTVNEGIGTLVCRADSDQEPVYEVEGIITDFPDDSATLWVVKDGGGNTTIMFPSEY
jgi:hypothetical protein